MNNLDDDTSNTNHETHLGNTIMKIDETTKVTVAVAKVRIRDENTNDENL